MGKIRSELVKRSAKKLIGAYPNNFSTNFEENKKKLKGRAIMPSNKIRNQIAGYITRLKKLEARSDEQTVRI